MGFPLAFTSSSVFGGSTLILTYGKGNRSCSHIYWLNIFTAMFDPTFNTSDSTVAIYYYIL